MDLRWFERPHDSDTVLRQTPRLASWNKATDPDQVRLRAYLEDTADLLRGRVVHGPWALGLDVGLASDRDLVDMADLDNFALPLAARLRTDELVSVWCAKRHAATSTVTIAPARETAAPERFYVARTTASTSTRAYQEQVRSAVESVPEIPGRGVALQLAFVVSPARNWLNLWKPTIDALDPLLGRTHQNREWHPRDGRILELGLHVSHDASLGHDVVIGIAAKALPD